MSVFISIVVPVYNVEAYLKKCIRSLVNQTCKNIEIILVDDGSTDGSGKICDEYGAGYSNVIVYHMENRGLSRARNIGIGIAKGDYIMFVDSDDSIELDACQRLVEYIKEYRPDMIAGDAVKIRNDKSVPIKHDFEVGVVSRGTEFFCRQLEGGCFHVMVWLYVYKRTFLTQNAISFRVNSAHEDEMFTPQALMTAKSIVYSGMVFYNYFVRKGSLSDIKKNDKGSRDFMNILHDLEKIYSSVVDEYFRKLLMEDILVKYMHICHAYNYNSNSSSDEYFVKGRAVRLRNIIKAFIYLKNKKLYHVLNSMTKRIVASFQ